MPIGAFGAVVGHKASKRVANSFRPDPRKRSEEPKGVRGLLTSLLGGKNKPNPVAMVPRGRPLMMPVRPPMLRNPALVMPRARFAPRAVTPDGGPVRVRPETVVFDPVTGMRGRLADLQRQRAAMRVRAFAPRRHLPPAAARAWRYPTRSEKRPSRLSRLFKNEANIWLGTWSPYK